MSIAVTLPVSRVKELLLAPDEHGAVQRLFEGEGCDFALLGGSQASGLAGWWSDVDVFVHVPCKEREREKVARITRLGAGLSSILHRDDIDVHDLDMMPVHVQFNAVNGGIVLYEKDDGTARANFVERMLHAYYEIAPWYEAILDERLHGVDGGKAGM